MSVDAISLEVFRSLFASIAEEMGETLRRASFSPNIKERLDFSCAVFDGQARMVAQAAHIPVHLGSMPASVETAVGAFEDFHEGDVVVPTRPRSVLGRESTTKSAAESARWTPSDDGS